MLALARRHKTLAVFHCCEHASVAAAQFDALPSCIVVIDPCHNGASEGRDAHHGSWLQFHVGHQRYGYRVDEKGIPG